MGGGGGTPGPTNEEKMLAEMANKKYDLAQELSAGSDYLTKMAQVDNTTRYEEKALADTAAIMANKKENAAVPVTGPQDLRTNISAAMAGKAQAEADTNARVGALVGSDLGNVGSSTAALSSEAARKMQLEQAEREAEEADRAGMVNMVGTLGGAYATNYKRVNSTVSDMISKPEPYVGSRNPASPYFRGSI